MSVANHSGLFAITLITRSFASLFEIGLDLNSVLVHLPFKKYERLTGERDKICGGLFGATVASQSQHSVGDLFGALGCREDLG